MRGAISRLAKNGLADSLGRSSADPADGADFICEVNAGKERAYSRHRLERRRCDDPDCRQILIASALPSMMANDWQVDGVLLFEYLFLIVDPKTHRPFDYHTTFLERYRRRRPDR